MPASLKHIRNILLPGLVAMGAKGSSGALYPMGMCDECGERHKYKWLGGKWLCAICFTDKVMNHEQNEMPTPSFTLQEINSAEDLVTKLSNQ